MPLKKKGTEGRGEDKTPSFLSRTWPVLLFFAIVIIGLIALMVVIYTNKDTPSDENSDSEGSESGAENDAMGDEVQDITSKTKSDVIRLPDWTPESSNSLSNKSGVEGYAPKCRCHGKFHGRCNAEAFSHEGQNPVFNGLNEMEAKIKNFSDEGVAGDLRQFVEITS